ncbi:MAG: class I SAM-dependent methyltransferase [Bacteroidales bacterium]|nr:class I SAM-dependent methyltransferase [Bacteroidales bacterium]
MPEINTDLLDYAELHSSDEDKLLKELSRETHLKALYPRMLSGHLQGKFLEIISRMIRPKNILEIGTFTGYSAICMAKGLDKGGKLTTIEINDEIIHLAEKYIHKAGLEGSVNIIVGDALQIIPGLENLYDLIFIDGEKKDYVEYYEVVIDKVRNGGYVIADNVLWDGKVIKGSDNADKETRGIINFNNHIKNDRRVENVILPIRDGLNLIRKKSS